MEDVASFAVTAVLGLQPAGPWVGRPKLASHFRSGGSCCALGSVAARSGRIDLEGLRHVVDSDAVAVAAAELLSRTLLVVVNRRCWTRA